MMKLSLFQKPVVKQSVVTALSVVLLAGASLPVSFADEPCPISKPVQEHSWLKQFIGEWDTEIEAFEPGKKAPVKSRGVEVVHPIGGFWVVGESKSTFMDTPFTGMLTLGYDEKAKNYIGTWVDSMTGRMWQYDGQVDSTGRVLTLESEGECPRVPGKMLKFKEVVEFPDKDTKRFTSLMQGDDGQWVTMAVMNSRRIK